MPFSQCTARSFDCEIGCELSIVTHFILLPYPRLLAPINTFDAGLVKVFKVSYRNLTVLRILTFSTNIKTYMRVPINYNLEIGQERASVIVNDKRTRYAEINTLGCWLFNGSLNGDHYGQIWTKPNSKLSQTGRSAQKAFLLHIISFISLGQPYNNRAHISHLCDNRNCFNPGHLVEESPAVNNSRKNCIGPNVHQRDKVYSSLCTHTPPCIRKHVYLKNETDRRIQSRG